MVPDNHPSLVAAMRGSMTTEADVVLTAARRLDFQLGFGSPAILGCAQFARISDTASELRDNRRGAAEVLAPLDLTLAALVAGARADTFVGACGDHCRRRRVRGAPRLPHRASPSSP